MNDRPIQDPIANTRPGEGTRTHDELPENGGRDVTFAEPDPGMELNSATARAGAVLPAIPAARNENLIHPPGPAAIEGGQFQCPFCHSVFPSIVAGRLGACPVCVAVANNPSNAGHTGEDSSNPNPPRWNRTGREVPVKLLKNPSDGSQDEVHHVRRKRSAHARAAAERARWKMFFIVSGLMISLALGAALAKRVYTVVQESARIRENQTKAKAGGPPPNDGKQPGESSSAQRAAAPATTNTTGATGATGWTP